MRTRLSAVALASGALAALLLGISMLGASETTKRVPAPPDPPDFYLLANGIENAFKSVPAPPPGLTATVNVPCVGKQRLLGESQPAVFTTSADRVSVVRQARCLHRHGFIDASDLASLLGTRPVLTRRGVGHVVPLSLQLEPSTIALSGWGVLVALELARALVFIRAAGQPHRSSTR